MCGIAGFLSLRGERIDSGTLDRMVTTLAHRGPDDHGSWIDDQAGVALGHRRLSILDLTSEGHQPMRSACGRYWIVFNGEIYNFLDLRERLEKLGHDFRGRSDTEVLLTSFTQWGVERAVRELNGMFAFAAWDREERALYLARDRLGEKPLYYGRFEGVFLFGSELKALRAHPSFDARLDFAALNLYMRYSYVPGSHSIFEGVRKLPAGTLLCVRRGAMDVDTPKAYWSALEGWRLGHTSPFSGSVADAERELDTRLRKAVQTRMLADVPVGAFLSGGIDSSTVVALMQQVSERPVRTFTVGFEERRYDEAHWARRVATHLGTEHTEVRVSPQEVRDVIPRLPVIYDEPFADQSQLPTVVLSAITRRQVTVALSGDGGDELFAGYMRYLSAPSQIRALGLLPRSFKKSLAVAARFLYQASATPIDGSSRVSHPLRPGTRVAEALRKVSEVLRQDDARGVYRRMLSVWLEPGSVLAHEVQVEDPFFDAMGRPEGSPAEWMMYADLVTYLPDHILVKVDRASMHVGLEVRVPFLDHTLVEFVASLPLAFKLHAGQTKYLLRRVLARYVPTPLINRPKQGFGAPLCEWLRGPLRSWADDILAPVHLRNQGIFRVDVVRQALAEHVRGDRDRSSELWAILMFQSWYGNGFGGSPPGAWPRA
jgi:asparagine synthase (glutamine-hydrolysing)